MPSSSSLSMTFISPVATVRTQMTGRDFPTSCSPHSSTYVYFSPLGSGLDLPPSASVDNGVADLPKGSKKDSNLGLFFSAMNSR